MIILGVDCGTQSTKVIALDWESGEILASAHRAYSLIPGLPEGAMEQHPEDWKEAMLSGIDEVIRILGNRKLEVRALGVSGQQHGLVLLNSHNEIVRPAKLWCDTSTTAQCNAITESIGGTDAVIRCIGNPILPGYTAPKIRWVFENEPAHWEQTSTVLLPHDYLNFILTGEKRMEYGDASGTALMDVRTRAWSIPLCEATAPLLTDRLPSLHSSSEPHGTLLPCWTERWGLPQTLLVSSGGGDNMMGAIGTGNVRKGVFTVSLGTSGTLFSYAEAPVIDPHAEIAAFCDSTDAWLPLVCTMNVTLVTEQTRKLFHWSHADFDLQASSVAPGSDGLLLLPYLMGERTPNLPNGVGTLYGLRTENFTPSHLARAAMEGVTLGLGYGLDRFRAQGVTPDQIHLIGGGSKSPLWRQICADIFQTPVVCMERGEDAAALGAAIQAGWTCERQKQASLSLHSVCARLVKKDPSTHTLPVAENFSCYAALQEKAQLLRMSLTQSHLL